MMDDNGGDNHSNFFIHSTGSHNNNRHLLSLVSKLCATLVPSDSDNFDKICRYTLDLITRKSIKIEDCEEQYLLLKIRHCFLKKSKLEEWITLENLYLKLKTLTSKSINPEELLYCLFLIAYSGHAQNGTIFSISNSIKSMKINSNTKFPELPYSNDSNHENRQKNRHTVHGYIPGGISDHRNQLLSRYSLLSKDLVLIFQGLSGKYIDLCPHEGIKLTQGNRNDLFNPNDICFAKRLSVLGQNFKTIRSYGSSAMNTTSRGLVVQSFGAALNDEIHDFYKLITSIQSNFYKTDTVSPGSGVTLHKLSIWTFEPSICFDALVNLITRCRSKQGGALISVVYDMMHHGDPIVHECLRKILSKVVKPIRKMLNHWIFYGELKDEYKEFFICCNDNTVRNVPSSSLSNVFWYDNYSINNAMLPGFISHRQAYKILITGKAISMLREVSMNKVSMVLPLYDPLKSSFENSKLETLFDQTKSHEANEFCGLLDYVYKEISQTALNILSAKYMLNEHFMAHKRFLLFEQGDFINYLMELLFPIINRPANKIQLYTLSLTLENAKRKTSAQYSPDEILSRLDIFVDQSKPSENAWDIFTIKYRIDGPIGTIFNEPSHFVYSKLFSLFWKNKRIEFFLNKCWVEMKINSSKLRVEPLNIFRSIFNNFHYLLHQIISFNKTIQQYYNYILESHWSLLRNELENPRNLNKLIKIHQMFLQGLARKFFFDDTDPLTVQKNLLQRDILGFIDKLQSFMTKLTRFCQRDLYEAWQEEFDQCRAEMDQEFGHWLGNFARQLQKDISMFLEVLIDTDEDHLRELCFSIDFNKYYKLCTTLGGICF